MTTGSDLGKIGNDESNGIPADISVGAPGSNS